MTPTVKRRGNARAQKLTAKRRQEIARKAAQARWKGKSKQMTVALISAACGGLVLGLAFGIIIGTLSHKSPRLKIRRYHRRRIGVNPNPRSSDPELAELRKLAGLEYPRRID